MPKIKTNRSAAKRFRTTATGKLKRSKAFRRHLLTSKSSKRKNQLGQGVYVDKTQEKNILRMLGQK